MKYEIKGISLKYIHIFDFLINMCPWSSLIKKQVTIFMGQLISRHSLGDKLGIKEVMNKYVLIKLMSL